MHIKILKYHTFEHMINDEWIFELNTQLKTVKLIILHRLIFEK